MNIKSAEAFVAKKLVYFARHAVSQFRGTPLLKQFHESTLCFLKLAVSAVVWRNARRTRSVTTEQIQCGKMLSKTIKDKKSLYRIRTAK